MAVEKGVEKGKGNDGKLSLLTNIKPHFVSVVPKGANRQDQWLAVKADTSGDETPAATDVGKPDIGRKPPATSSGKMVVQSLIFAKDTFTLAQARTWVGNHDGFADYGVDEKPDSFRFRQFDPQHFVRFRNQALAPGVTAVMGLAKGAAKDNVPAANATDEAKTTAQAERAMQFGIEALKAAEEEDAQVVFHLSFPEGGPTTLDKYGDPVNLTYPLDDAAGILKALTDFRAGHAIYGDTKSKARVFERIVRAALKSSVEVTYDPNDEIDSLLPADLAARLVKESTSVKDDDSDDGEQDRSQGADLSDRLAKAQIAARLVTAQAAVSELDAPVNEVVPSSQTPSSEGTNKGAETEVGNEARRELKKAQDEVAKMVAQVTELTERVSKAEAETKRLKTALTEERAKVASMRTRIGTQSSINPADAGTGATKEDSTDGLFSGPEGDGDLAPPLTDTQ